MQKKGKKVIEVILNKNTWLNIEELAITKKVRPGYFRNYIIPSQLGRKATPKLLKELELNKKRTTSKNTEFQEKCQNNKKLLENMEKFIL